MILPNSIEDIVITSQKLCEEYMEGRLARSGMKEFRNVRGERGGEEYSNILKNMGQILEMKYPRLYTRISHHLRMSYDSEILVWDSFNKFALNLFSEGVTWCKIIALFAFTGGLALDCTCHGRGNLLAKIVYWFGLFVMKKLALWIQREGGWLALVNHFKKAYEELDSDDEDEQDEKLSIKVQIERKICHLMLPIFLISVLVVVYMLCIS